MIKIRAAQAKDAGQIAGIYAPYVTSSAVSFELDPPDAAAMAERMASSGGLYPWIVATTDNDDAVQGYAYAGRFRERPAYRYIVESSIYLGGGVQGQGVGRLLYAALIETLTQQDFTQAIAILSLPNEQSIALHEALGFRRAGIYREIGWKNGQWHDVGMWQRELAEPQTPPQEPSASPMWAWCGRAEMRKTIPQPSFLDHCDCLGAFSGERRWRSPDGMRLYTWDSLHGEIEVYDRRGGHLGAADALTGRLFKPPRRGRTIDV